MKANASSSEFFQIPFLINCFYAFNWAEVKNWGSFQKAICKIDFWRKVPCNNLRWSSYALNFRAIIKIADGVERGYFDSRSHQSIIILSEGK